ncbi:MAG: 16S rRNA (guanine(966)-N(2))-methyltransferase RsmD [Campylobacteraceae bacterium]
MSDKQPLHVNVQGGKFKGKKLLLPPLEITRSTKSILKSSYFNTVQFDIVDSIFIEAFGGSGSMGLEAISRGAKSAYFIEQNREAFEVLKKNIKSFENIDTVPILGDTFIELPKLLKTLNQRAYIYLDPPFDFRDDMDDIYEKCFKMVKNFSKERVLLLTFEHSSKVQMPNKIGSFELQKSKTFGNSTLSYYM